MNCEHFEELLALYVEGDLAEREAQTLASLTGANLSDIRARTSLPSTQPVRWWETLWK